MKDIVIPTLEAEDIEVKIKQVTKKGAFALLYKTARTDMEYLDKIFGIGNWQCHYEEIKGNLYCTISIWDEDKNQWISKQDCGIESREDGEGNEKKGEASDSFKRSGFKVGIGRELYSSPKIFLNVSTQEQQRNGKTVYVLDDPWAKYVVTEISYDKKRKIDKLLIANEKTGEIVYRYGISTTQSKSAKQEAPKPVKKQEPQKVENKEEVKSEVKANAVIETSATLPKPEMKPHEKVFYSFIERHHLGNGDEGKKKFAELRAMAVRGGKDVTMKKFNDLTPDEWVLLIATMENLFEEGFFTEAV